MRTVTFLFGLLLPAAGSAQSSYVPMIEQARDVWQVRDPHPSRDGSRIVFSVSEPEASGGAANLWVYDVKAGTLARFSKAGGEGAGARWSPDGTQIAVLSRGQVVLYPATGGEPTALTKYHGRIRSFAWSPNGRQIAFIGLEPEPAEQQRAARESDMQRVMYPTNNSPARTALWLVDVATTSERRAGPDQYDITSVSWSADGTAMVVIATDTPNPEKWTERIFTLSLEDGAFAPVAAPQGPIADATLSPDGAMVAFVASRSEGPDPHDLYVVPTKGGVARNLTGASIDRPVSQHRWLDNSTIEVLVQSGFKDKLYTVTTAGMATSIALEPTPSAIAPMPGGGYVFSYQNSTQQPELWLTDTQNVARQVTNFNEKWQSGSLAKPEYFTYESFDGLQIEAALLKPSATGGRFPLIVLIHQGPVGRWADRFDVTGQLLAARGYAVMYPNIRGGVGYGQAMIDMIRSEAKGGSGWGAGPFKDVMAGVDELIRRGVADPDRLGIAGSSYGGYMAAWAITQTDRFKAAVASSGVYNMMSDFGQESTGFIPGDEWAFGQLYEPETTKALLEHSPVTYVRNARTPILMFHGEVDPGHPIEQSYELYRGLERYNTGATEFYMFPGTTMREAKNVQARLNKTLAWLDMYVKGAGSRRSPEVSPPQR